jgi:predicted molibdopterin-dependent oxidoreductase YjgC
MLAAADRGELDALYIIGEDPLATYPEPAFVKRALARLDFLLVQDIFLTETARAADCVLPGAAFAEKEGTFTNQEGRVQAIRRLMRPPGQSWRDFKIIAAIGGLFDPRFAAEAPSAAAVFEAIRQTVGMYRDVDLTFQNQRNEANDLDNQAALIKASGAAVGGEAVSESLLPGEAGAGPFTLITGNHLFHSGRLSRKSAILNGLLKEPVAEISAADAAALGIASGAKVRVKGRRHEAVLTVKTRCGSKNGLVFIDENFENVAVNRFFQRGAFTAGVSLTIDRPQERLGGS